MEPSVYILILLILIILVGSACCSGVEAAFLAVNSIRILEIASKQKPKSSANQLLKLRKHLGRTLTVITCLLYTSPSPRDNSGSRMPSSA